jgi:hypothetical protein
VVGSICPTGCGFEKGLFTTGVVALAPIPNSALIGGAVLALVISTGPTGGASGFEKGVSKTGVDTWALVGETGVRGTGLSDRPTTSGFAKAARIRPTGPDCMPPPADAPSPTMGPGCIRPTLPWIREG